MADLSGPTSAVRVASKCGNTGKWSMEDTKIVEIKS